MRGRSEDFYKGSEAIQISKTRSGRALDLNVFFGNIATARV